MGIPAVLYTTDLEPITVVDLPQWAWDLLARGDRIYLAAPARGISFTHPESPADEPAPVTVSVFAEQIRRGRHATLMLFTHQDADALQLKSALLPGQRADDQARRRRAFYAGVVEGLRLLRP